MYQISQLMSTPAASSSLFDKEPRQSISPGNLLPSYTYTFLDSNTSYECCSINPLTGSLFTCRRSPRLLTNGYYILTEDSFLSDEDGNVTLTPSQTSITYKEKLVRIFRRRKKIRRSLTGFFGLGDSDSWLNSTVLSHMDSSHGEETWNDGDSKLGASQRHSNDEYFHEETLDYSKWNAVRNVIYQMIMLSMCLIISVCTRCFLGGRFGTLLVFLLMIILVYAAKSCFIILATSFKTTTLRK
ncbi:transmembrane protein 71 isoform X2 [Carettochelys insculpta]|uniref:transmembrane protein 71 isoform X2 n=1 Tax=Carettochelys insculpta TaxID=44489 RepID=UPI003EBB7B96